MFDNAQIYVKAGDGGKGCTSFKGKKFTRYRRSDGGPGGKGGNVFIKADINIHSLDSFRYKHLFHGENGGMGQDNHKKGKDALPLTIKVPLGTIVRDTKNHLLLGDLQQNNEEIIVAHGGSGGRGNTRNNPATAGGPGEERYLSLEWKLISDVGIVGCPNAGKSAFLAQVSSARPKIAAYPFTTTSPSLGRLEFADAQVSFSLTLAEMPGLIKDSHQGKGLGINFLRHIERIKALILIIDMSGQEGKSPLADYQELKNELQHYNREFLKKPWFIAANKMDIPEAEKNLKVFRSKVKKKVYPISALTGQGIDKLIAGLQLHFQNSVMENSKG
ncbi:MAG: Obg family GTPase CgtA [Candidatus Omnitrophota bacterium]